MGTERRKEVSRRESSRCSVLIWWPESQKRPDRDEGLKAVTCRLW